MLKGNVEANNLERSRNFQYKKTESTEISVATEGLTESATGSATHFLTIRKKFLTINRHQRKLLGKTCGYFFSGQGDRVINDFSSWSHL